VYLVKGPFIPDPEAVQDGDTHANGESQDIDIGGDLVPGKIAPGQPEETF
jgi:hypothetical protein